MNFLKRIYLTTCVIFSFCLLLLACQNEGYDIRGGKDKREK